MTLLVLRQLSKMEENTELPDNSEYLEEISQAFKEFHSKMKEIEHKKDEIIQHMKDQVDQEHIDEVRDLIDKIG